MNLRGICVNEVLDIEVAIFLMIRNIAVKAISDGLVISFRLAIWLRVV